MAGCFSSGSTILQGGVSVLYFVNDYFVALNSGIEHAEIKRAQLFKHQGIAAKIVTQSYNSMQYANKMRFGLSQDQVINMYDYFQGIVDLIPKANKRPTIATLNLAADYNVLPGNNVSRVYDGDRLVMDVHFIDGTVGQLGYVDHFDQFGKKVLRVLWDYRGFKSREEFYSGNGDLVGRITYNPAGKRIVEEYFALNKDNQLYLSSLQLVNYRQQTLYFTSHTSLFSFFLDELNRQGGDQAAFIADRPGIAYDAVLAMQTKAPKYVSIPTTHTVNPKDQVSADLAGIYANALVKQVNQLTGIIVATEAQKQDLLSWFGGKHSPVSVFVISQIVVPDQIAQAAPVLLAKRHYHEVIVVGHLTKERQTDQVITAFQQIYELVPDARLLIYGYGDQQKALTEQIKQAGLEDVVFLKGYQPDLRQVYDQAWLYINTSSGDSQPLALGEALSHGVPAIAYRFNYGPADLIQNGVNGYLIENDDISKLAQQMLHVLTDDSRWQTLSHNAYISMAAYTETNVMAKWQFISK